MPENGMLASAPPRRIWSRSLSARAMRDWVLKRSATRRQLASIEAWGRLLNWIAQPLGGSGLSRETAQRKQGTKSPGKSGFLSRTNLIHLSRKTFAHLIAN